MARTRVKEKPDIQISSDLKRQVRELLDQGRKIEAVKLYKHETGVGLAEAKAAVEALQTGTIAPPASEASGDLEAELLRLLGRGDKRQAIKLYKDRQGVSLAEAKETVDVLAAKYGLNAPRAGCLGVVAVAAFILWRLVAET